MVTIDIILWNQVKKMILNDVKKIVDELKELYPTVYFKIEYSEEDDLYGVTINDAKVAHSDDFNLLVGEKLVETVQAGDIFNAYFCYDSELEDEITLKKINFISNTSTTEINEYNFFDTEYSYVKNTKYSQDKNLTENSITITQNLLAA